MSKSMDNSADKIAKARAGKKSREERLTVLFDIRTIIGVLFGIYGLVCLIWGLVDFTSADSARAGGVNINLWAGIGLLLAAAVFIAWSLLRPLHPPEPEPPPEKDA